MTVSCKGRECPKRVVKRGVHGTLSLASYIRKAFRSGTVITVKVERPGAFSMVSTLTIRKGKAPLLKQA